MERECCSQLSQAISQVAACWRESARFVHSTALIVRVHLWSVLHDRPTSWACVERHWDQRTRPQTLPDQSTMSRRKRGVAFERFMNAVGERLAGKAAAPLLQRVDGKPMPVAAHSKDRSRASPSLCDAAWGRGASQQANGYKLHAIWGVRPMPQQWAVTPLNVCEKRTARRMVKRLEGGGYLLADSLFDDSNLHDCAAAANHQLIARVDAAAAARGWGTAIKVRAACVASPSPSRRRGSTAWARPCATAAGRSNATLPTSVASAAGGPACPPGSVASGVCARGFTANS